jgi:hypothetical protein
MSDETDPKFSDPNTVIGVPQDVHRAPEGEGARAPLTSEGADHAEFSVFDGAGNEQVAVVGDDATGKPAEGTGNTAAEASEAIDTQDERIGGVFKSAPGEYD